MPGLYVHIPFCQSKCRYCAFYSEPVSSCDTAVVVSAILQEMSGYDLSAVDTVYIGGGSPSVLPHSQLFRIVDQVFFYCRRVTEFTVEVNPSQVDSGLLHGLFAQGVNRLSIGAQSFDDTELKFLGRRHNAAEIERAFELARSAGFGNISLDLIFAIPGSTADVFERSLDKVISLGAEHISAYSLSIEPGTSFGKAHASGNLVKVDEDADRAMYEMAIDNLAASGYDQYEISNFSKPGYQCKHNLSCWANDPYVGVGPAAGSYFDGVRFSNIADVNAYTTGINSGASVIAESCRPDVKETACETAVLNLRRMRGIVLDEFKQRTGFDAMDIFPEAIERNLKIEMLKLDEQSNRIHLSKKALPVADSVLCDFANF